MNSKRVLVVDDSQLSRMILCKLIGGLRPDWSVDNVGDPTLALEQQESTPYDLVVSDFNMPQMNGIELIKQMQKKVSNTQFCLLTANVQTHVIDEAGQMGIGFFGKPITEALVTSIIDFHEQVNE